MHVPKPLGKTGEHSKYPDYATQLKKKINLKRLNQYFNTFKNKCITSDQLHHTIIQLFLPQMGTNTIIRRDMK